jgi:predicted dehydrogenase
MIIHGNPNEHMNALIPRRTFLGRTVVAATAFSIVPRHVLDGKGVTSPSDKLNIAGIGIGGMGQNNLAASETENIVALCDVDSDYAAKTFNKYPQARRYKDFRVLLDQEKDLDAVIVATPDHTHAVIALAAIQRGKHVYVQKPMTHSVYEARILTEAARRHKVMTQMGNQGHSGDGVRLICEWIWDGEKMEVTNDRDANAYVRRQYRQGWTL